MKVSVRCQAKVDYLADFIVERGHVAYDASCSFVHSNAAPQQVRHSLVFKLGGCAATSKLLSVNLLQSLMQSRLTYGMHDRCVDGTLALWEPDFVHGVLSRLAPPRHGSTSRFQELEYAAGALHCDMRCAQREQQQRISTVTADHTSANQDDAMLCR